MSLKTPQNKRLVLALLMGSTGKSERHCKGLINRMSNHEFMKLLMSDGKDAPEPPEKPSEPVSPKPARSPAPAPKKRSRGRPKGSTADSRMKLYSFMAPPELMDELSALADKEMTSSAAFIRSAVRAFLDEKSKPK